MNYRHTFTSSGRAVRGTYAPNAPLERRLLALLRQTPGQTVRSLTATTEAHPEAVRNALRHLRRSGLARVNGDGECAECGHNLGPKWWTL